MQIGKKKLATFTDERGGFLVPIEFKELPFVPKRLFYVTDVPRGHRRGEHAHFETEQLLICVKGKIGVQLSDGSDTGYTVLSKHEYVHISNLIWDAQDFLTGGDVLLVLCSTNYDADDYISTMEELKVVV